MVKFICFFIMPAALAACPVNSGIPQQFFTLLVP